MNWNNSKRHTCIYYKVTPRYKTGYYKNRSEIHQKLGWWGDFRSKIYGEGPGLEKLAIT